MSPEAYALHRERVLWLSEFPLIEGNREEFERERTRQLTLSEVAQ